MNVFGFMIFDFVIDVVVFIFILFGVVLCLLVLVGLLYFCDVLICLYVVIKF